MELLHSNKLGGAKNGVSSQKYVDVEEIKDDVIILKNKALRAVLMVSSINFDLKSTEEQDAIIMQYQTFLNSLDFPMQVVISSRKLNIAPYLNILKERERSQDNELMKLQISEYMSFINNLTDVSQIMSKFFYIVVPFSPIESKEDGVFSKISNALNRKQKITENKEAFETYKNQLWQRVDQIEAGLSGIGVRVTSLKTEEIIELLYNFYNPSFFKNSIIKDIESMDLQ